MKKILIFLSAIIISVGAFGQNLNTVNKRIMVDTIRAIGNLRVPYTGATTAVNLGSEDLATTGATTTGSLATEVLQVGDATSSTILLLDSLSTDGTTYSLYDGATQLAPNIPESAEGVLSDYVP